MSTDTTEGMSTSSTAYTVQWQHTAGAETYPSRPMRVEYDAEDTWVLNLYVLVETNKPGVNNDAQAVTLTYPATTTAWQAMLDVPLEYKRGGGYTFVFSFGEGRTAYLLCNKKDALVLRGLVSGALSMRTVESE